jgi:hypothetical protein
MKTMQTEFKPGDRIKTKTRGKIGTVLTTANQDGIYSVAIDNEEAASVLASDWMEPLLEWHGISDFNLEDEIPSITYNGWAFYIDKEGKTVTGILIVSPNGEAYTANPSTLSLAWHVKQAEIFIDNQSLIS